MQAKILVHPNPSQRDQQVAKREYMKKVTPLINKCFAIVNGTKTLVVQRCIAHGIGCKEVVSYKYRDLKTMKEQFTWTVKLREFRTENHQKIEYNVTVVPIHEWLKSEDGLTFREKVFNPRP